MKIKHFTHTDCDGVGCAIVSTYAYGESVVEVEYCDYHNIDQKISDFLDNSERLNEYTDILITDISVKEDTARALDILSNVGWEVALLDHHPTAEWLNRYDWATVTPNHTENTKASGTTMTIEYLIRLGILDHEDINQQLIFDFAEKVRRYDTWEWKTKYNDLVAKNLNDLFYIIGRERFFERFLTSPEVKFYQHERLLLDLEQDKIEKYIKSKDKQMKTYRMDNYLAGVVFAENYFSEMGNVLAENHPELDLIVMINPSNMKISYRTVKDEVDLSEFASKMGGGGHLKASGSEYEYLWNQVLVGSLFGIKGVNNSLQGV